jgi:hypothetical protein
MSVAELNSPFFEVVEHPISMALETLSVSSNLHYSTLTPVSGTA